MIHRLFAVLLGLLSSSAALAAGPHGDGTDAMFGGGPVSTLGGGLVLLSLLFATVGCGLGFVAGYRRDPQLYRWAQSAAYGFSGAMIAANFLMVYALVTHDFSVRYVAEVGSRATPLYFTIVSLWASLNGSILFWGGILGIYTAGVTWHLGNNHREYAPWVLHVQLGIAIFFAFLVASIANPFAPVSPVPPDGPGPNPLLQNHWLMAVHPPMLYLGYVGMSVPYSMICASLLAGRMEAGWMAPVRRWMLIPWTFLSVGIVLGGWWSYAVLGWGGAWAWDPVENASFHPWLTGTAFVHSAMVLERRGRLRDWTLLLGMSTFLLTLVGTFMTRSGVFNSVHSFTQSDIGPVFLVFIGITLTYSLLLLTFRAHKLDEAAQATDQRLGAKANKSMSLLSRETAILVQNGLFSAFTFTVLIGTLWPLIVEAVEERRISVGEPYFDKWALPIGLGIVFMMGVGPMLPWGRQNADKALWRALPAAVFGVLTVVVFAATGFTGPISLLTLFVVGFTFWSNANEILDPARKRMATHKEGPGTALRKVLLRGRRRFGGHVAHYGVLMAVFALALSKGYRVEQDFPVKKGDTVQFQGYDVHFAGAEMRSDKDEQGLEYRTALVSTFELSKNGSLIGLKEPRMNFYKTQREPIYTPDVHSRPWGDLYFSIISVPGDGSSAVVRLIWQPFQVWMWLCAPMIALGTLICLWPERRKQRSAAPAASAVPPNVAPGSAK